MNSSVGPRRARTCIAVGHLPSLYLPSIALRVAGAAVYGAAGCACLSVARFALPVLPRLPAQPRQRFLQALYACPFFSIQTVLGPANFKGFVVLPKRWIVERTFGWLGRYRRHSKDYERNTASSEAMIYIAMNHIMPRRLVRLKS